MPEPITCLMSILSVLTPPAAKATDSPGIPAWVFIVLPIILAIAVVLILLCTRKRKKADK